ncbi:coniferyl aldehyde dehydrogenase [Arenimonas sp.]|jgi:coniferyl-aldehyde dehydrogenase|uniref:coniferyl aldehyde dehydrogenase n=1 Tax=Arenimonas sp. TaxID=1872635 RepID=UPI0037BF5721
MTLRTDFDRLKQAHLRGAFSYQQRIELLSRLDAAVRRNREAVVEACSRDFGRRARIETLAADVMVTLDEIKHARKNLRRWMRPQRRAINLTFKPARGEIRYTPLGVVGVVAPWNYPFQLAIIPLANAIAAGNRVMIKPSEFTPSVSALIETLIHEVFSADEVVVVQGDASVGAEFTRLPFDHLIFTGSTAVGRHVMAAAAANLTPVTLELGGKSPALIAADYPIAQAADRIAFGKCFNAGQTCVAPDYVLLPEAQLEAFITAFAESIARRYPNMAANPEYTGIINERQSSRLQAWLDEAKAAGVRTIACGPEHNVAEGLHLMPPTVLVNPPDNLTVMQQEIFGPLLPVLTYRTLEQALDFVLARDKPLAFYLFDRESARVDAVLGRICAGSVCINDVLVQFGQDDLPIGGVGASGMGHYHGRDGFLTFSKAMPVMHQARLNGMHLFNPPYGRIITRLVDFLTKP